MLPIALLIVLFTTNGPLVVLDDEAGAKGMFPDMQACEAAKLPALNKIADDLKEHPNTVIGSAFCFDETTLPGAAHAQPE